MVVLVWTLVPSIPIAVAGDQDVPTICECGCGNPKGQCCCVAPKANPLAFGCSQREDPNDPVDTADGGKIIGPPASARLGGPTRAPGDLEEPRFAFSGLGLRPEIPPPQA
jgi:hypothetical protein